MSSSVSDISWSDDAPPTGGSQGVSGSDVTVEAEAETNRNNHGEGLAVPPPGAPEAPAVALADPASAVIESADLEEATGDGSGAAVCEAVNNASPSNSDPGGQPDSDLGLSSSSTTPPQRFEGETSDKTLVITASTSAINLAADAPGGASDDGSSASDDVSDRCDSPTAASDHGEPDNDPPRSNASSSDAPDSDDDDDDDDDGIVIEEAPARPRIVMQTRKTMRRASSHIHLYPSGPGGGSGTSTSLNRSKGIGTPRLASDWATSRLGGGGGSSSSLGSTSANGPRFGRFVDVVDDTDLVTEIPVADLTELAAGPGATIRTGRWRGERVTCVAIDGDTDPDSLRRRCLTVWFLQHRAIAPAIGYVVGSGGANSMLVFRGTASASNLPVADRGALLRLAREVAHGMVAAHARGIELGPIGAGCVLGVSGVGGRVLAPSPREMEDFGMGDAAALAAFLVTCFGPGVATGAGGLSEGVALPDEAAAYTAAQRGDVRTALAHLEAAVRHPGCGWKAVHVQAEAGDVSAVEAYLRLPGADPGLAAADGTTIASAAALGGATAVVAVIEAKAGSVGGGGAGGTTADLLAVPPEGNVLVRACEGGHLELATRLLDHGGALLSREALVRASRGGHRDVIAMLAARGLDVTAACVSLLEAGDEVAALGMLEGGADPVAVRRAITDRFDFVAKNNVLRRLELALEVRRDDDTDDLNAFAAVTAESAFEADEGEVLDLGRGGWWMSPHPRTEAVPLLGRLDFESQARRVGRRGTATFRARLGGVDVAVEARATPDATLRGDRAGALLRLLARGHRHVVGLVGLVSMSEADDVFGLAWEWVPNGDLGVYLRLANEALQSEIQVLTAAAEALANFEAEFIPVDDGRGPDEPGGDGGGGVEDLRADASSEDGGANDGADLDQQIESLRTARYRERAGLLVGLARAVRFVHSAGLVHGAVAPCNVLLSSPVAPMDLKLTGFTLSAPSEVETTSELVLNYRAPEGPEAIASDVFSLAAVTCEGLTFDAPLAPEARDGVLPFDAATTLEALAAVPAEALRKAWNAVPEVRPTAQEVERVLVGESLFPRMHNNVVTWAFGSIDDIEGALELDLVAVDGDVAPGDVRPIHVAASLGRVDMIDFLIGRGAEVAAVTAEGDTALHLALRNGHTEAASVLVEVAGRHIGDLANGRGEHPVYTAAGHCPEALQFLDLAGADTPTADGETAIFEAVRHGHTEVVGRLATGGASAKVVRKDGVGLINLAAAMGMADIVSYFLSFAKGFYPVQHTTGTTALFEAASRGHVEVVKALLDDGHPTAWARRDGLTPLLVAIAENHQEVAGLLLNAGASLSHAQASVTHAMHVAVKYGRLPMVAAMAKRDPACLVLSGPDGLPLNVACRDGQVDVAAVLLDQGAPPTPESMRSACFGAGARLVSLLIDRGAAVEPPEGEESYVVGAARLGLTDVVTLLLESGADGNACTADTRDTALHLACQNGHLTTVRALIAAHVDSMRMNVDEWTAVDVVRAWADLQPGGQFSSTLVALVEHAASIAKSGWLQLQSHTGLKTFKKRWFVLRHDGLWRYGKTKDLSTVIGLVPIHGPDVLVRRQSRADKKSKFFFSVETDGVEYLMHTKTAEDREAWIGHLVNVNPGLVLADGLLETGVTRARSGTLGSTSNVRLKRITSMQSESTVDLLARARKVELHPRSRKKLRGRSRSLGFRKDKRLHDGSFYGNHRLCSMLIREGAEVDQVLSLHGETPFVIACTRGHASVALLLAEAGADIWATNARGESGLVIACSVGLPQIVAVYAAVGADLDSPLEPSGLTPAQTAASSGRFNLFPSLIREGADLNAAAADGSTALHSAVAAGQADTVRALVKLGAHVFARDGGGTTPVDLAVALARGGRIAMTLPNGGSRVLDVEQAVALEILATLRNPKMVVIEGWLHKRTTSTLKTFKRRWFALSADGTLRYGQSPDGEVKVDCSLFDVEGVHPSTSADKRNKLHFVFEFGDEVVATFYAASESERLQWVDACLAVNPAIALLDTAS